MVLRAQRQKRLRLKRQLEAGRQGQGIEVHASAILVGSLFAGRDAVGRFLAFVAKIFVDIAGQEDAGAVGHLIIDLGAGRDERHREEVVLKSQAAPLLAQPVMVNSACINGEAAAEQTRERQVPERRGRFRAKEQAEIALFVIDDRFAVRELAAILAKAEAVPTLYVRTAIGLPLYVGVFEAAMKVDNRGIVDHEVWACCHVKVDVAVKAGVGVD